MKKTSVIDYREPEVVEPSAGEIKSKNPHEVSLGKFFQSRAVPVSGGYQMLSSGQIIKLNGKEL